MLETEYNQEEVLKIVAEDAARRSEKKFSELIKKLSPGSKEYEEVLNASHEKLEELYKKYESCGGLSPATYASSEFVQPFVIVISGFFVCLCL